MNLKFWRTPVSEIEAIANRKLMETLISISIARAHQASVPCLEASRLIRQRVQTRQRRKQGRGWRAGLQRLALRWLGLADVQRQQDDEILFIGERLKLLGDALGAADRKYHCANLMLSARNLEDMAGHLAGNDKRDIQAAAQSVRLLAARFSDNKEKKEDNDESTANASA